MKLNIFTIAALIIIASCSSTAHREIASNDSIGQGETTLTKELYLSNKQIIDSACEEASKDLCENQPDNYLCSKELYSQVNATGRVFWPILKPKYNDCRVSLEKIYRSTQPREYCTEAELRLKSLRAATISAVIDEVISQETGVVFEDVIQMREELLHKYSVLPEGGERTVKCAQILGAANVYQAAFEQIAVKNNFKR